MATPLSFVHTFQHFTYPATDYPSTFHGRQLEFVTEIQQLENITLYLCSPGEISNHLKSFLGGVFGQNETWQVLDDEISSLLSFQGGADAPEVCSSRHRAGAGASALCAGDGQGAPFHDQEGSHQHGSTVSQTVPAPRAIPQCE